MKRIALLVLPLLLAACSTFQHAVPVFAPTSVKVPVAVACNPDIGPDPDYADSDAALLDPLSGYDGGVPADAGDRNALAHYLRTQKLVAGRLQRIAREGVLKAALDGCRGSGGGEDGIKVQP
jgi:hypothetical protein